MPQLDPYYVLNVSLIATPEEIRAAYRRRAAEIHPDLQPAERRARASEQMKQLNAARDRLLDPRRRARYDEQMRLDMHQAMWRARRDAYAPAAPPRRRRRGWGCSWPFNVLAMFLVLMLCVFTLPFQLDLASLPQAAALPDTLSLLALAGRLALILLVTIFGPLLLALALAAIFGGLSRFRKD